MTQRSKARAFPWREAMAFGFGVLRLAPEAFWSMTPRELALAAEGLLGRGRASGPPSRAELEALIAAFPDSLPEDRSTRP